MFDGGWCFLFSDGILHDGWFEIEKIEDDVIQITVPHDLAMIIITRNKTGRKEKQ